VGKTEDAKFDRARDEMMSHVIRCDVLDAEMEQRTEWLAETMEYMAERYPMLSDLELTKLEMIGKQFIKPPIPHGKGNTARSRDKQIDQLVENEIDNGKAEPSPSAAEDTPEEGVDEGELVTA
jgi:hypothetical protein